MADRKGQTRVLRSFSHLSQPKCLTSPTWLRLPVSTRQSWRRRRQKRKTPCPPKRVSVPCVYVCVSEQSWSLQPLQQFPCQSLLIASSAVIRLHAQQAEQQTSELLQHQHIIDIQQIKKQNSLKARQPKLSPSFLFQPLSRRGKAMPHLDFRAHEEKKLRCHSKKHFLLIITVLQSLALSSEKGALELPGVPQGYMASLHGGSLTTRVETL